MENASNVYVLAVDFGWSDLGTWGSLYENLARDDMGNAIVGKDILMYDSKNCIVNMSDDKVVVLQGLTDYIVVESENILLVCRKSDEQQIRQFVNDVRLNKGENMCNNPLPEGEGKQGWGYFKCSPRNFSIAP